MFTDVDTLITRTLQGDSVAWTELAGQVHVAVLTLCSSLRARQSLAFLADGELEREVAVRVLDRLKQSEYRALANYIGIRERYRATEPDGDRSFARWLTIVTKRLRIDYLRSLPEYLRVRAAGGRQTRQVVVSSLDGDEFCCDANVAQQYCDRVDVRRILATLAQPGFPSEQRAGLLLWLKGYDAAEIAAQLGLDDAAAARRLVHSARQRLRRLVPRDDERARQPATQKRGSL